ncbi:MAG: response regulator, partial [Silicimonas sp.]|nr:response regulator [Silicimonas sp.]
AAMAKSPVHLVISDYFMPEMDGLHLLHYLRSNPQTQKTGFLLITGKADPAIINKGKQLGMNNYLAKPFQTADLKSAIEAIVGRL